LSSDATEHDRTAQAKKVVLVDSTGSAYSARPRQEQFLGSDCTGADGATGRVLTLTNTRLVYNLLVHVNGVLQDTRSGTDYTLTNLAASSTIAFVHPVFDVDVLLVVYYE